MAFTTWHVPRRNNVTVATNTIDAATLDTTDFSESYYYTSLEHTTDAMRYGMQQMIQREWQALKGVVTKPKKKKVDVRMLNQHIQNLNYGKQ